MPYTTGVIGTDDRFRDGHTGIVYLKGLGTGFIVMIMLLQQLLIVYVYLIILLEMPLQQISSKIIKFTCTIPVEFTTE